MSCSRGRTRRRAPGPCSPGGQHPLGEPPHDRDGSAAELAGDQLGERGQLVGDGRRGHRELVAVGVGPAGEVVEGLEPGRPDGEVGLAGAPGPAGRVGDDHGHVAAGLVVHPLRAGRAPTRPGPRAAARRARGVRWTRPRRRRPSPGRGGSPRSRSGPRRATTRTVSSRIAVVALTRADPALGLADHLAGDQHDVAVAQVQARDQRRRGRCPRSTSPMPSTGQASRRRHRSRHRTRSSAAATMSAVASWSVIQQRYGAAADAGGLIRSTERLVGACPPASRRGRRPCRGRRSARPPRPPRPRRRSPRAAVGPCRGRGPAPMIPETPTTGAAVATSASRMPGTPRIVPTETTGLDGGTSTTSASVIASSTPGPGLASSMPIGTTAWAGTAAWWRIQYSWKCTARARRSPGRR